MKLSIKDLSFNYGNKKILSDFSMELGEENPVAILGPSGCGKTTMLRLIGGLLKPGAGTVSREGSGRVSFVFQEPRLLPWRSVLENVAIPVQSEMGAAASLERARRFLSLVSLEDKLNSYPNDLSGGQKQRAAIARAFAYPAPLMLMDEPFQSLDIPLKIQLMDTIINLLAEEERFLIAVTHDPHDAVYLAERYIVMDRGGAVILDEKADPGRDDGDVRRKNYAAASVRGARILEALASAGIAIS